MDEEVFEQEFGRRHHIIFRCGVAYRYHRRRQRFFDFLDKGTKAITVLAGASLLSEFVKQRLPVAAAVVSGVSLLSLVYGYSDRKQCHRELADEYARLLGVIHAKGQVEFVRADVNGWTADFARLQAKEPPTLRTLAILCENEESIATGHPADAVRVALWRRAFADWFSLPGTPTLQKQRGLDRPA